MSDETGQVAGVEALVFGTLILLMGTLVISNLWAVIDARFATTAAAQEAARTFVEATNPDHAGEDAAAAARAAIAGYGRNARRAQVTVTSGRLERCSAVTVRVSYPVSLGGVPVIGRLSRTLQVTSEHTAVVDPYRAGLSGEC